MVVTFIVISFTIHEHDIRCQLGEGHE